MDQLCRTSLFGTETWLAKRNDSWPTNFLHLRNSESKISYYNTIVIEKHYLNQWHVSYIIYPYILKKSKLSNCCWAWSWRNFFINLDPFTITPSRNSVQIQEGGSGSGRTFDTAIPLMLGPATIPKCNACVPRTWNLSIPTHTNMDRRIPVLMKFGASERFQLKHLSCWTAPGMNDTWTSSLINVIGYLTNIS